MKSVLHKAHRPAGSRLATALVALFVSGVAASQVYGPSPITGGGGRMGPSGPSTEIPSTPAQEKPDKAARKAYAAGQKSLAKARELEEQAAKTTDPEKRSALLDKLGDTYGKALDQFTEVLRNRDATYDAWNQVGLIHLRLGAFRESIDDYNHALALKPDLQEAIAHRAQAYLAVDRIEDTKLAYLDLFNHARPFADELLPEMHAWVTSHRATANGVRPAEIDAFDRWLIQQDGIAKTAANP